VVDPVTKQLDKAKLADLVRTGIMMLDDAVDTFKLPVKKVQETSQLTRRTGLGLFGWAEYLILRGIPYDSEENLAEIREFMSTFRDAAIATTRELAQERGVFPLWSESVYAKDGDRRRNAYTSSLAPTGEYYSLFTRFCLLTFPKTGTTSMIADLCGGIEPLFKVAYVKQNILGGQQLRYVNPLLMEALKEARLDSDGALIDEIIQKGTVQHLAHALPERIVRTFNTAEGVTPEWHVRVQAEFQKYVDNAISKVRLLLLLLLLLLQKIQLLIPLPQDLQFPRVCHGRGRDKGLLGGVAHALQGFDRVQIKLAQVRGARVYRGRRAQTQKGRKDRHTGRVFSPQQQQAGNERRLGRQAHRTQVASRGRLESHRTLPSLRECRQCRTRRGVCKVHRLWLVCLLIDKETLFKLPSCCYFIRACTRQCRGATSDTALAFAISARTTCLATWPIARVAVALADRLQ
jgi:hypothetical protein